MSEQDPGFLAGAVGGITGFMAAIGINWRRESKNAAKIEGLKDDVNAHVANVAANYPTIPAMNAALELHLKPVADSVDRLCDRVGSLCTKIDALEDREREYLKERR